jgi:hypothetical protein
MVDQDMIDSATGVRLLIGLVVVVYGYLIALGSKPGRQALVIALIGVAPLFLWIIVPTVLDAGEIPVPVEIRRLGLLSGAIAVALRYGAVRARERSLRQRSVLAVAAGVLVLAAIGVTTANWLVTVAAAVSLAATARISPSGASSGEGPSPHQHRGDT